MQDTTSNAASDATLASLQERVEQMHRLLSERGLVPPDATTIEQAKQHIFDTTASERERLRSLHLLRRADARTDDVVLAMVDLYSNSKDPDIRADIFRQLDGVQTPALRTPLLTAVAEEEVADVREEAAETLAHFLPDDDVRQWLEYLRDQDPDEDVRRQAERSLGR